MRNKVFAPKRQFSSRPSSVRNGSFRSHRNSRRADQAIDVSRFVNKAKESVKETPYVPVNKFADFPISGRLKNNIIEKGYSIPTPIQDQAIPEILKGRDLIGIANTGTGKTAAFLIPFINKALADRKEKTLIIAPTRELALQIQEEMNGFAGFMGIFSAICVGGANIRSQMSSLRHRPDFVVGTPGRLKDLVDRKFIKLSDYRNLVLDEADRMLDMGFLPDIKDLLSGLPADRQSVFFSATMPIEVERLISEFSRDPIKVSVKSGNTASSIDQDVVMVARGENKMDKLHDLLLGKGFDKVLIFGRTKYGVENLSVSLNKRGFKSVSIHGDKTQSNRQRALRMFKDGTVQIMVATDVAARGLDIPNVSHVINFDLPSTYEDYVHRIGRTGRADKKGNALTFIEGR
ncbi:MAG: DEAD/DEAH box helicase [Candidatus Colwellbacteria bacterium]|nr:DEAD/DEAH box helicase [Candidatus Colwellbacteria bacterium]